MQQKEQIEGIDVPEKEIVTIKRIEHHTGYISKNDNDEYLETVNEFGTNIFTGKNIIDEEFDGNVLIYKYGDHAKKFFNRIIEIWEMENTEHPPGNFLSGYSKGKTKITLRDALNNVFSRQKYGWTDVAFDAEGNIVGVAQLTDNIHMEEEEGLVVGNFSLLTIKRGVGNSLIRGLTAKVLSRESKYNQINFAIVNSNLISIAFHSKLFQIFKFHNFTVERINDAKSRKLKDLKFTLFTIRKTKEG